MIISSDHSAVDADMGEDDIYREPIQGMFDSTMTMSSNHSAVDVDVDDDDIN